MKFDRLDHVKRPIHNTFWDGLVLGSLQTIDGKEFVAVERFDHQLFFCDERELQLIEKGTKFCRHNRGFHFKPWVTPTRHGWECNLGCGYSMNFNPEFMDGIAYLAEAKPGPVIEVKASKY